MLGCSFKVVEEDVDQVFNDLEKDLNLRTRGKDENIEKSLESDLKPDRFLMLRPTVVAFLAGTASITAAAIVNGAQGGQAVFKEAFLPGAENIPGMPHNLSDMLLLIIAIYAVNFMSDLYKFKKQTVQIENSENTSVQGKLCSAEAKVKLGALTAAAVLVGVVGLCWQGDITSAFKAQVSQGGYTAAEWLVTTALICAVISALSAGWTKLKTSYLSTSSMETNP